MVSVDIVLPVYNEEKILRKSVTILAEFLKNSFSHNWKIIIADNASIDRTLEIGQDLTREIDGVEIVHLDLKGRGRAVRRCWLASKADIVCYMDIDLSTELKDLPVLINAIIEGNEVATGCRLHKDSKIVRSFKREILSRGYLLILKTILGINFNDAQCGFKAIRTDVFKKMSPMVKDDEWFFDSELLFKAERMGFKIKEIPITWIEDPDSRVNIRRTVINYIISTFRVRWEFTCESLRNFFNRPNVRGIIRNLFEGGEREFNRRLPGILSLAKDKKVLDIGCGGGQFSTYISGYYVGFDSQESYIRYACRNYPHRKFLVMDARNTGFRNQEFDMVMVFSLMHHLPNEDLKQVLGEIDRVARKDVVFLDLIPQSDLLSKFFYSLYSGKHLRPLEGQLDMLRERFEVVEYSTFSSGVNLHSLILCRKKEK